MSEHPILSHGSEVSSFPAQPRPQTVCTGENMKKLLGALMLVAFFAVSSAAYAQEASKRSEEHTSELQSPCNLVCRLLLEKKKQKQRDTRHKHIVPDIRP